MGLLDRLLGRQKAAPTAPSEAAQAVPCPHVALVPQWDAIDDIGKEARASRFVCPTCSQRFTPDEATALRESEAERLKQTLGT